MTDSISPYVYANTVFDQISTTAPLAPSFFFFSVGATFFTADDYTSATATYPGVGSPQTLSLITPTGFDFTSPEFTSLTTLQTAYPFGTYTVTATGNQPTSTSSISYQANYFPNSIPALTNFSSLNGLDPENDFTVNYNSFTPDANVTTGYTFLTIWTADTHQVVFHDDFQSPSSTEALIPANTLFPNTAYTFELDFSDRVVVGSTTQGFDMRTDGSFTTSPVAPTTIYTISDLQAIQNNLSGNYVLGADIDATGFNFTPIGNDANPFTGTFDGHGYAISNLTINSDQTSLGLFGEIGSGGTVRNVSLTAVNLTAKVTDSNVGGLAGENLGSIINTEVTGSIKTIGDANGAGLGSGQGHFSAGGLVGYNAGVISASHSDATINATHNFVLSMTGSIGGLVGVNGQVDIGTSEYIGSIVNSYATGDVSGTIISSNYIEFTYGGFAGGNFGTITQCYEIGTIQSSGASNGIDGGLIGTNTGTVQQSYAMGSVSSTDSTSFLAGLVGWDAGGTVEQSYSTGLVGTGFKTGGLIAANSGPGQTILGSGSGTVANSYWDTQTSGQPASAGGEGLTTTQLTAGLPSGFDSSVWALAATINNNFPYLQSFLATNALPAITGPATVNFTTNQTIAATSLYTNATDPDGSVATIRFWDSTPGAGYFALDGTKITTSFVDVTAANLSHLTYITGANAGSNDIVIDAFDNFGAQSADHLVHINVNAPGTNQAPVITGASTLNLGINQIVPGSQLYSSASDPDGSVATIQFWDATPGAGHFTLDGVAMSGSHIEVAPDQLSRIAYVVRRLVQMTS
jgi:M26 IgA1-specific Metallo-endopeptidase N-terminal region